MEIIRQKCTCANMRNTGATQHILKFDIETCVLVWTTELRSTDSDKLYRTRNRMCTRALSFQKAWHVLKVKAIRAWHAISTLLSSASCRTNIVTCVRRRVYVALAVRKQQLQTLFIHVRIDKCRDKVLQRIWLLCFCVRMPLRCDGIGGN